MVGTIFAWNHTWGLSVYFAPPQPTQRRLARLDNPLDKSIVEAIQAAGSGQKLTVEQRSAIVDEITRRLRALEAIQAPVPTHDKKSHDAQLRRLAIALWLDGLQEE